MGGIVVPTPQLYRAKEPIIEDRKELQRYLDTLYQALQCPSFRIHRNGVNQLAVASGATTTVQWNSTAFYGTGNVLCGWDTHNGWDYTNFRYTFKVPGVYLIGVTFAWDLVMPAASQSTLIFTKNGAGGPSAGTHRMTFQGGGAARDFQAHAHPNAYAVGETVQCDVIQNSGAAKDIFGGQTCAFWGYKLPNQ